jgi:hypothetical protein
LTEVAAGPPVETAAAASELLANCRLIDVRPIRIFAEILEEGFPPVTSVDFVPTLELLAETGQFSNRFAYRFDLNDAAGQTVATVGFTLVLDWAVPSDFTPDRSAADFITRTTGYFAAFPYARELLHSLSTRLGIDPVVLGALNRENLAPTTVTIALRPPGLDDDEGNTPETQVAEPAG